MSIQGLLQKGTNDCGYLEKAADALLTVPRFLWLGREVTLQTKNNSKREVQSKMVGTVQSGDQALQLGKDREPSWWVTKTYLGMIVAMVLYPLAIPFLAAGLACKKISLLTNAKAKNYHEIVEVAVKDAELMEKQQELNSRIKFFNKEIETMKNKISSLDKQITELSNKEQSKKNTNKKEIELNKKLIQIKKYELSVYEYKIQISETNNQLEKIDTSQKYKHQEVTDIFNKFQTQYSSKEQSK